MNASSTSFSRNPPPARGSSHLSSRLSYAVSQAEQGDVIDDDDDDENPRATAQIQEELAEIKRYETRRKARRRRAVGLYNRGSSGWRFRLWESYDAAQGWIVVTLVGIAIGFNAALLSIITEWLSDIKLGHCTTAWYLNEKFCCWGEDSGCTEWQHWTGFEPFNYAIYIASATFFAFVAATLVKTFAPYAAGSGISEIKCIVAGFVMKGFLSVQTLAIKSLCLPLAIGSGLSVGKEGPTVHYAVCTGSVISRLFNKYRRNASKTREILSASAAAGVAVAFGSPIGGVLFSLEEISNYFPLKTMWRSYFCALVATAVLAAMNPFRTGQLVMFQVSYDREWHFFEIVFYILLGVFGGLYGAFVIKWNLRVQEFRKKYLAKYAILEALLLAFFTAIVAYPNAFLRIEMTESMEILFLECEGTEDYDGLCQPDKRFENIVSLALATALRIFLVIISYGCKVPAGIFVPSMAVGASFGRAMGIVVQALHEASPDSAFFAACKPDETCITPGTYAFLGAAAALSGIMHITVTVVVIMFELTGALTYILPTMIVVGVTKTVSEQFGSGGIADRMIWFSGFPFLDNKHEHNFGVSVSRVMRTSVVTLPVDGMTFRELENLLSDDKYQGFPVIEGSADSSSKKILVGYIGSTELRYAIDRIRRERPLNPDARCLFAPPPPPNHATGAAAVPMTPTVTVNIDSMASTTLDFSRFVDATPVTAHPRLPLETVMEIFRKIGPRVILVEYQGQLTGLVTVKDCLKYQVKVEAAENPKDNHRIVEGEEQLWAIIRRASSWVSAKVFSLSGGRIRLDERHDLHHSDVSGRDESILDGTEDLLDEGVELETR
ncbi:chloride channel 3/4/5 [Geosmithia morbida]|uniref:Chloride channel protein n=1 Tax=Geosmithia morbida TaxID=1094350 RepID=A0A9P4YYI1_9HYPO|nr:chloride channel 3/4/5 [Geosmithia morbida]KAF4125235.1 chloride channel 3/4/5 [Geosmithia morbida]